MSPGTGCACPSSFIASIPASGALQTPTPASTSSPQGKDPSGAPKPQQIGEGSYEGTRDYQKGVDTYLANADVASDARAARRADDAEAAELKQAEQEGLSHSKAKGQ